jgi:hypothetical protein
MVETLFARAGFQAFIFAGGICILLAGRARPQNDVLVIYAISAISILAILAFVVNLFIQMLNKPEPEPTATLAQTPPAWPDDQQIRISRGFMILGLLIYLAYHFLDGFVILTPDAPRRVEEILFIRIAVGGVIALFWVLSFTPWFRTHYVALVTIAITIAGIGVGAMLYIAGPEVHFYYEGFIQVIAFAAFAFKLPPRPLAFVCALMMTLYAGVSLHQVWDGQSLSIQSFSLSREQQAIFANNLVALLTFVTLAMVASSALKRE